MEWRTRERGREDAERSSERASERANGDQKGGRKKGERLVLARARDREGKSGCLATSHLVRSQPATRPATLLRSLSSSSSSWSSSSQERRHRRAEGNGAPFRSTRFVFRSVPSPEREERSSPSLPLFEIFFSPLVAWDASGTTEIADTIVSASVFEPRRPLEESEKRRSDHRGSLPASRGIVCTGRFDILDVVVVRRCQCVNFRRGNISEGRFAPTDLFCGASVCVSSVSDCHLNVTAWEIASTTLFLSLLALW